MNPGAVVAFAVVFSLGMFALFWWGWSGKLRRQAALAPLPDMPSLSAPQAVFAGHYVSTTTAGDWLDRLAAHGLGIRTRCRVEVHGTGVWIQRFGARDLFIPQGQMRGAHAAAGMAGKFVGHNGLILLTWSLGKDATLLDTGIRLITSRDRQRLLAALEGLLRHSTANEVSEPSLKSIGQRTHEQH